ncbi:hypothetical protein C1893_10760 [Pseudomonas sp. MPR-ANC1]|uniref:hypothetical protein n=1 Tax=Pseudomonas sp. MPR-ANC1 TaxID=2075548 RepID=UPI000CD03989|nr:hypothetical protein [Pseudomonas sp. MPR-ANC1]POA48330.1 hypothetical protein C1893_10760 [Pseudomonas sp. MPR-ANC1]
MVKKTEKQIIQPTSISFDLSNSTPTLTQLDAHLILLKEKTLRDCVTNQRVSLLEIAMGFYTKTDFITTYNKIFECKNKEEIEGELNAPYREDALSLAEERYRFSCAFNVLANWSENNEQYQNAWLLLYKAEETIGEYFYNISRLENYKINLTKNELSQDKSKYGSKAHAYLIPLHRIAAEKILSKPDNEYWESKTLAAKSALPELEEALANTNPRGKLRPSNLIDTFLDWTRNNDLVRNAWEVNERKRNIAKIAKAKTPRKDVT